MNKWFYRTYQIIAKYRFRSFFGLLLILAGILFLAEKIQFEEDISKLIPSNSKSKEVQKILKSVNFTDKIIVNIKRQPDGTLDDLVNYATGFVDSLEGNASEYVKHIQGKVAEEDIDLTLEFLYKNTPLFLNQSDYDNIAQKLSKDSIEAITNSNYKTLLSPTGIIAKKSILRDPLGISFMALQKLQQLGIGDQFTLKDGFLLSKDEQHIVLFISPAFVSSETARNDAFAAKLYEIQNNLNAGFTGKVESEYFGAALIAVANAQQIKKDIQFTVGIALTLLILIFIVFYRKLLIPFILFAPTLFGGLLSIAILYLIRTEISAISLGIGSVLLGVTLDYSLHILTHIRNNESIENLYRDIAKPILMSSLTTALAFLCLLFIDSQALQDLGIFAAVSVLGASVFALLFIPQVYKGVAKKKLKSTLLDRVASYKFHKNKWLVGLIAALVVLSAFTYDNVIFNKDISKLNYEPPAATKARENLDALTNIASKSMYLAAFGNTTEAALQSNDSVFTKLQMLKDSGTIISFSSIGSLLHSEAIQNQKIRSWKQFWNPEEFQQTKNNLIESGSALGFKPTTFNQFYTLLESDFQPLVPKDFEAVSTFLIDDFINEDQGFTTVTSLVKVDDAKLEAVRTAFKDSSNILVIDRKEMNETLLGNLKNEFNSLIGYSLLVVFIILLLFFRSLSLSLVTAIPIFLTWIITIGVMGLLGLEFNIFNIIISTFIFGLGIDYSIFMTIGMLKEYQTGEDTLATHKTSIILSVITTILGVGVLIFAKHPALYSISVVSIIGIFSAMLVSFTVQPLLFHLFIGSKKKRPVSLRLLTHSVLSFAYYGLGGLTLSIFSVAIMPLIPLSTKVKMRTYHKVISKFMKSVLFSNPFITKRIINEGKETFHKPGIIIANHTSFLDILAMGMLHPKIIFLVNDWVYNSPIFGKAVQMAGFYPVSGGIENGVEKLKVKVEQGYCLMAFPEGTRSTTNKVRRFHKGAFFLAEKLNLDIIPAIIHGNSEVLPKGSFIIRDGSVTIKILGRITPEDKSFGSTYKDRTKNISAFFRKEFDKIRDELEGPTYFHNLLKLEYRYKGDALYSRVSKDLNEQKDLYLELKDIIGKDSKISDLSNGEGLLDLLLLLDSADRRICTYIENEVTRAIVKNSFITNHYNRILFAETKEEALAYPAEFFIFNKSFEDFRKKVKNENNSIFEGEVVFEDAKLIIFKQKINF
jgi:1-acyl-sn-glycerol-3-phosphate acyltransferase